MITTSPAGIKPPPQFFAATGLYHLRWAITWRGNVKDKRILNNKVYATLCFIIIYATNLVLTIYIISWFHFSDRWILLYIVSTYQINLVSTYKIFITIELYYVYFNYKKLGLESVYLCLFTTLCEQRIYFSRGGILRK